MTYYHVRLTPKSSPSSDVVSLDLSLQELNRRVIEPYNKGQTLVISGKAIAAEDVDRILVTASNQASAAIRALLRLERLQPSAQGIPDFSGVTENLVAAEGQDVTDQFITGPPGWNAAPAPQATQESRPSHGAREVFVVHGRNAAARDAMFQFLRSLDLHPLEWPEVVKRTGKGSPTNMEIVDAGFRDVQAIVVLFTPDDEARLRESLHGGTEPPHEAQATGQARPNVIFEAGMAMGKHPDRTILVELGPLRPFSDISGINVIRLDDSPEKRNALVERLATAACPISRIGNDWLSVGDFASALALSEVDSSQTSVSNAQEPATTPQHRLSDNAVELLVEGSNDSHGVIQNILTARGLHIATNDREFVDPGDPRSEARWRHALSELLDHQLVEDRTGGGKVFYVTLQGFQVAEQIDR